MTEAAAHRWRAARGPAVALAIALVSLGLGVSQLGSRPTDTYSERNSMREAQALAAGQGRYGIYEYTHYPNGPIYVMAALLRMGVAPRDMRLVPVTVSALALGLFALALRVRTRDPVLGAWVVGASLLLAVQPGVAGWQGALHEHAYALALFFVGVAAAAWLPSRYGFAFAGLGFVAGWVGFDWLPGQAIGVVVARGLHHAQSGVPPGRALLLAGLDGLRFVTGACLAILSHLGQLAFFFGSLDGAIRDLLGSAAVRMGTDAGASLNPDYAAWLKQSEQAIPADKISRIFGPDFDMADPAVAPMLLHIFQRFWREAVWPWAAGLGVAASLALTARELWRRRADGSTWPTAVVAGLALVGAMAASVLWSVLVPRHAVFHAHILFRHFLMGLTLILVLPVLLSQMPGPSADGGVSRVGDPSSHPALDAALDTGFWLRLAAWSSVPLALLGLILAAALGAGAA